jgi:cell division protein FtsB
MIFSKKMHITKSLIIFVGILLGILLVLNTTTNPMITNVFAESEKEYEKEERSNNYLSERENKDILMINDYNTPKLPMLEEYDSDRYGGYYGHYESEFYLDQYSDGSPYKME